MQASIVTAIVCLSFISLSSQQPPGVPPKAVHQPPQHQQTGGHAHQQVGGQQQQRQPGGQQQQQQPGGHGHQQGGGHGHGHGLQFSSEVHNADHILEHLQNVIATKKKEEMTEEELEFHYFKLHDYDNNNKLDGVEIGKALTHFHDENDKAAAEDAKIFTDAEISNIVDSVFSENDENIDGYIEYIEFKRRQSNNKEQHQQQQQQQQQQQDPNQQQYQQQQQQQQQYQP